MRAGVLVVWGGRGSWRRSRAQEGGEEEEPVQEGESWSPLWTSGSSHDTEVPLRNLTGTAAEPSPSEEERPALSILSHPPLVEGCPGNTGWNACWTIV